MKRSITIFFLLSIVMIQAAFAVQEIGADNIQINSPKDFSNLYGMDGFTKEQLAMHFKLYEGYVKNTNLLNETIKKLIADGMERTPQFAGLKRMYGWEYDGMRLHEYYFGNLGGLGELSKDSDLYKTIASQFGSFENWKKVFTDTGMIRGIGWVILYLDPHTGKLTNEWVNEHDGGHLTGNIPLLVMDVWEHAYITVYGINRGDYIEAFFKNINWDVVNNRYMNKN